MTSTWSCQYKQLIIYSDCVIAVYKSFFCLMFSIWFCKLFGFRFFLFPIIHLIKVYWLLNMLSCVQDYGPVDNQQIRDLVTTIHKNTQGSITDKKNMLLFVSNCYYYYHAIVIFCCFYSFNVCTVFCRNEKIQTLF